MAICWFCCEFETSEGVLVLVLPLGVGDPPPWNPALVAQAVDPHEDNMRPWCWEAIGTVKDVF
jgi:hypothetical protein